MASIMTVPEDREALVKILHGLYRASNDFQKKQYEHALYATVLTVDQLMQIIEKMPELNDIIRYSSHRAADFAKRPEYFQGQADLEAMMEEKFAGPITKEAIELVGIMKVMFSALSVGAPDEFIIDLWGNLKEQVHSGTVATRTHSPLTFVAVAALQLGKSVNLVGLLLEDCSAFELSSILTESTNISEKYYPLLTNLKGFSSYASSRFLRLDTTKTITRRIEAINSMIASMSQDQMEELVHQQLLGNELNFSSIAAYALLEALFKYWKGPACDLLDAYKCSNILEVFLLGQTLETLLQYISSQSESSGKTSEKFRDIALGSAIKKFGYRTVWKAEGETEMGKMIHAMMEFH